MALVNQSLSLVLGGLTLGVFAAALSGCGNNFEAIAPSAKLAALSGTAHGGPQAVVGATINYYATTSGGYGAAATLLSTATTASDGSFTFVSPAPCPTGQQGYVTAYGGNPGSGTNANYLLMAALGPCAGISASTTIFISEVTTTAAAYALRPFTTITTAAGVPTVNIGAPANNNAAAGACTITGTATTGATSACTSAGLTHAFGNALNLASSVSTTALGDPTGTAYQVPPSNANGSVPAALLNAIANSIESCVNSTGGAASDAGGTTPTNCGRLFSYTTPPGGAAPTNTLQALLNLAQYPTLGNSATNIGNFFTLAPATAFFQPTLTAAPTDYSVAIAYSGVTLGATTTTFQVPFTLALDSNDDVFIGSEDSGSAPTLSQVFSIGANGASIFATTPNTTLLTPRGMATDTLGHVWVVNNGTTTATQFVQGLNSTNGSAFTNIGTRSGPFGIAIDRANNVWIGYNSATITPSSINEYLVANATQYTAQTFSAAPKFTSAVRALAFDANQNLYVSGFTPAGTTETAGSFPNTGTVGNPTHTTAPTNITLTGSGGAGIALDSANHVYTASTTGLFSLDITYSGVSGTISNPSTNPIADGTDAPFYTAVDGANAVWFPSNQTVDQSSNPAVNQSLVQYVPGTATINTLMPCYAAAGATTCVDGLALPQRVQPDSTGSLWITSQTNGRIYQLLGTGTPTWPQLSLTAPGVMPQ